MLFITWKIVWDKSSRGNGWTYHFLLYIFSNIFQWRAQILHIPHFSHKRNVTTNRDYYSQFIHPPTFILSYAFSPNFYFAHWICFQNLWPNVMCTNYVSPKSMILSIEQDKLQSFERVSYLNRKAVLELDRALMAIIFKLTIKLMLNY